MTRTYGHRIRALLAGELERGLECAVGSCKAPAVYQTRMFLGPNKSTPSPASTRSRWVCKQHGEQFARRFGVRIEVTA